MSSVIREEEEQQNIVHVYRYTYMYIHKLN